MKEAEKVVKKQIEEMLGMSVEEFKEIRDGLRDLKHASWESGHPEEARIRK